MSVEPDDGAAALDRLAHLVIENAATRARREANRASAEARRLIEEAEDHVAALRRAARALGRTRGLAAERALERESQKQVESIVANARAAFGERFRRRLVLTIEERLGDPAVRARAFAAFARDAATRITGPVEVRVLAALREEVYDALLAAGVDDFQVLGDPRIHAGFVVGDLDGRTVFDARPRSIVEAHAAEIDGWLADALGPFALPAPSTPAEPAE